MSEMIQTGGPEGDTQQEQQNEGEAPNVAEMLNGLTASINALGETQKGLQDQMNLQQQQMQAPHQKNEPAPQINIPDIPADIEAMDRKDVIELTNMRTMAQIQRDVVQPIMIHLKQMEANMNQMSANHQIAEARKGRDDFDEWGAEIAQVVKGNPNLPLGEAYDLVKMKNPDKAKKLAEKFEKKEDVTKNQPITHPVSMRPTSSANEPSGKMGFNEAANNSWNENAAGLVQALSSMETNSVF